MKNKNEFLKSNNKIGEYKKTSIGEIPVDWDVGAIKEIFFVKTGTTPSTKNSDYWDNGLFNWITPSDLSKLKDRLEVYDSERKITEKALNDTNLEFLPQDSIILSTRAPVGYVGLIKKESAFNQGCKGLIPKDPDSVDSKFYCYWLSRNKYMLENLSGGSTFKELAKDTLSKINIPVPPLPEQKKIAEILSTVDEAIQKSDKVIEKTERLKKGMMQQLLTRGIGHVEFKETPIGEIPVDWDVGAIKEIFFVKTGTTPSTKNSDYWDNGLFNWITPSDLSKLKDRLEVYDSERKITEKALNDTNLEFLPQDSIILSTRAPVGYVGLIKKESAFNQGCKGLIPKDPDSVDSKFYCYWLSRNKYMLENLSGGSTFKELAKDTLSKINIPVPPLPEQKKIAEILSDIDKKIELERKRREKLTMIKKGIMNDLLTGRRRVEMGEV
ncbi:MAG: restriction endonuclease subunit S [Thermodesulfovibrionales bacterium]|nr:restriction endonuclease subunit S [Thermodesulfovibrionales bacterium]